MANADVPEPLWKEWQQIDPSATRVGCGVIHHGLQQVNAAEMDSTVAGERVQLHTAVSAATVHQVAEAVQVARA